MSIIKKEFVRRVLKDESDRFKKNQGLEMHKLLHFHTNKLHNDREFKVESSNTMDGKLIHSHVAYQRFLDIKRKIRSNKSNRIKKSSYPIHNRFVFGHYFSIANRLMYEFTNEVAEGIKKDFQIKR